MRGGFGFRFRIFIYLSGRICFLFIALVLVDCIDVLRHIPLFDPFFRSKPQRRRGDSSSSSRVLFFHPFAPSPPETTQNERRVSSMATDSTRPFRQSGRSTNTTKGLNRYSNAFNPVPFLSSLSLRMLISISIPTRLSIGVGSLGRFEEVAVERGCVLDRRASR